MATSPASNWEDRLAATAASLPTPASNWEDRLRSLDLSPKPNPAEGDGSTLRIGLGDMLGGRLNVDTGIPIGQGTANFLAGAGAGLTNLARGVGQKVGLVSAGDIHEARKLDAPLMDTWAGKAGDLAGTAAGSLPAVLIPGAGTYAGAAKVGAGLGLLAPAESFGELAGNTALGGVGGAAGNVAGRALGSLYGLGKSAVMPFFESGQAAIEAGRTSRWRKDFALGYKDCINESQPSRLIAQLNGDVHVEWRLPSWPSAIRLPTATAVSLRNAHYPSIHAGSSMPGCGMEPPAQALKAPTAANTNPRRRSCQAANATGTA